MLFWDRTDLSDGIDVDKPVHQKSLLFATILML